MSLEKRSLIDELSSFDSGGFFDLGHPLLNRVAESFVKAAGVFSFFVFRFINYWFYSPEMKLIAIT